MDTGSNLAGSVRAHIEDAEPYGTQAGVGMVLGLFGSLAQWLSLLLTTRETGISSSNTVQSEPVFQLSQKGASIRATG